MHAEPEASSATSPPDDTPYPPVATIEWDAEGRVTRWSPEAEALFGWSEAEVRGKRVTDWPFVHPGDAEAVARVSAGLDHARQTFSANRNLTREGRVLYCEWYNTAVTDEEGRLTAQLSLVLDVSARVRARQDAEAARREAERARRAAEEANRAKSGFLATMSHEIRTPINAMMGYTDLLEMELAGPLTDQQRQYLSRIHASGEHLLGLVTDVLDFAKIEAGEMVFVREPVPVQAVAKGAMAMVAPQARSREVALEDEGGPAGVSALGDPDRVRQIVLNLLSNAVKFTQPGGRVRVRAAVRATGPAELRAGPGPWVVVEVEDTGIGIAPEHMERIFEPFRQVDETHTREQGGTGLGLAISRRFARLMGGDITARSRPGEGSVFTLWLPPSGELASAAPEEGAESWPTRPGEVPGLGIAGKALEEGAEQVVRRWAERVARDPGVPTAHRLDPVALENHAATFLVETGTVLVAMDAGAGAAARDDDGIRRAISTVHGAQRARLGFTAAELGREYDLLCEETEAFLRREMNAQGDSPERAAGLLCRLLDDARTVAMAAHASVQAGLAPDAGRAAGSHAQPQAADPPARSAP
jgi:PAS domain S-box-containing protein